jgi:hypothetical protein
MLVCSYYQALMALYAIHKHLYYKEITSGAASLL